MKIFQLSAFLALCLSAIGPAGAAPLTFNQVAQHAYDAGFRGGSLTYAIAVADAESGREPLAVSNNYAITLEDGTPVMLGNGKQRIEGVQAIGPAAMVPVLDPTNPAAVRAIPELRLFGRPVSHCSGLWQMNDALENPHNQPLDPFDPRLAAVRAWRHTRCGVHWWRYISVMRGTAWEPSRLAAARKAATRLDPSTPPDNPKNLRVIAMRDGGVVREDLTKNMTRKTRAGDLSGIATVEYGHDGGAWQPASGRQNWTAPLATAEGPHLLEVRATDPQGNASAPQSLTYVVQTPAADPATFTEQLDFGGTTQHWEEAGFNPGPGGFSGFQGGLYADGDGFSAAMHRLKTVPAWAHAVELTFTAERQALFRWEDDAGAAWQGGIRSPAGVHEAILGSSAPAATALAEQPLRSRVKILLFNGRMTLQAGYGPPPIQHLAAMDVPLPGLRLAALRTLRWQVDAPDGGAARLKEVRIRALRHSDLLQISAFQPRNESGRVSLEWASYSDRTYQIFYAPALSGPWLPAGGAGLASGIRAEAQFPAPAPGARMFYRVQELIW